MTLLVLTTQLVLCSPVPTPQQSDFEVAVRKAHTTESIHCLLLAPSHRLILHNSSSYQSSQLFPMFTLSAISDSAPVAPAKLTLRQPAQLVAAYAGQGLPRPVPAGLYPLAYLILAGTMPHSLGFSCTVTVSRWLPDIIERSPSKSL